VGFDNRPVTATELPYSPAADRNAGPVLDVLRGLLPAHAAVLEVASGTGQHAQRFATDRPGWHWQPTDGDPRSLPAIAARCAALPNVAPAISLDVLAQPWPPSLGRFDALYCANMLHIAPWACCAALMQGAAGHLVAGGLLLLYGPYLVDGVDTAPGNLAFDADLRARDARWGLRRLADVVQSAGDAGLAFDRRFEMPANNLLLVFSRQPPDPAPTAGPAG
jgi:hypothetical protein